jgi:hypothetical protein
MRQINALGRVLTWLFVSPPQDNSGTIERDEFLSLPQISSNPLATRSVCISPSPMGQLKDTKLKQKEEA